MFRIPRHLSTRCRIALRKYSVDSSNAYDPTITPVSVTDRKHPTRGGQNLTDRYDRLERSLRGKSGYEENIQQLMREAGDATSANEERQREKDLHPLRKPPKTFMGYVIPERPKPPEPDECCMSGCAVCVYDLYNEALEEYRKAVDSLRTTLDQLHVPKHDWPKEIRSVEESKEVKKDVTLSAFEELERQLREKKAQRQPQTGQ
ncbi:hypothetical protein K474DRAFT_1608515 [Panus rudis PR-1116 ss-1]|nr:hypothetical protein K474DRAFT_1608515 [Panus rudis PR-1116 ss-1]